MAKLGFKPGDALGKKLPPSSSPSASDNKDGDNKNNGNGKRAEPLNLHFKEDRGGIGLDSEKKRRFREEAEEAVKKVKREEGDYRDRVREERESRRVEGQILGAQKVAERLDTEAEEAEDGGGGGGGGGEGEDKDTEEPEGETQEQGHTEQPEESTTTDEEQPRAKRRKVKPTLQINILYRGMVRQREDREKSILARHALHTSLPSSFFPNHSRLPTYEDETMEKEDKEALGTKRVDPATLLEQELDEEDPELDEFNALEPAERLRRLVMYLREKYRYCFWCKFRYEDEAMEGCPGVTEEDHD